MARVVILGAETGDSSELASLSSGWSVVSAAGGSAGAYAYQNAGGSTTAQQIYGTSINRPRVRLRFTRTAAYPATPFATSWSIGLGQFTDGAGVGYVELIGLVGTSTTSLSIESDNGTRVTVAWDPTINQNYCVEIDFRPATDSGSADGECSVYVDGVLALSESAWDIGDLWPATNVITGISCYTGGTIAPAFSLDDIAIDDAALPGIGFVIARQPNAGGSPTYNAWTKSTGTDAGALLNDTPFSTADFVSSSTSAAAQTAEIATFASTQTGHGTGTIASGDTVNGVKAALIAKTDNLTRQAGSLLGTLVGNAASIGTALAASGSVAVKVGDLVVTVLFEQAGLTSTGVTDNLGNTYTAQNAGTTSTNSGRMFYSRVTVAGTLTAVTWATNGGANNGAVVAGVFAGPFLVSPINATPANVSDTTTPYTSNATGALSQAHQLVVGWATSSGSATWTATAPMNKAAEQATASIGSARLGYQTVSATTSISTAWTGTAPTNDVLGAASFRFETNAAPEAGAAFNLRRRMSGLETDTAKTLTTNDAYYETSPFTSTPTTINNAQVGGLHSNNNSALQTIEDVWLMVDYTPAVVTASFPPYRPPFTHMLMR
jgi:hypothetical protein